MKVWVSPFLCAVVLLSLGSAAYARPPSGMSGGITNTLSRFLGSTASPLTNALDVGAKAGNRGSTPEQPWSSSYWPLYRGSIANPYDDGSSWIRRLSGSYALSRSHYVSRMANLKANVVSGLDAKTIDEMAPSEKYDLYLGDPDFSLTNAIWQSLDEHKLNGGIHLWEGSCHGWCPASLFTPRPNVYLQLLSLDGRYLIPFYPDDVKALVTLLWANSLIQDQAVLSGVRCNTRHPNHDASNGKILDTNCQGVNAGIFHLAILQLLGIQKTSFVINRQNNTQVWNQPISAYQLTYYNPITTKEGTLSESIVDRTAYADPFASYRDEAAKYIVGVDMTLTYMAEASASHSTTNIPLNDTVKKMILHYDLELDADHNVLGGEWVSFKETIPDTDMVGVPDYPGFMWRFPTSTPKALSIVDQLVPDAESSDYNSTTLTALSKQAANFRYNRYAIDASGNQYVKYKELRPQPIAAIVNTLQYLSHQE